jgi:hypothetical protein
LIFSAVQSRPIMVKTESQKVDGKVRLQVGDIWIKKGTALQRASRSDIDLMYRQRMEEEAEDRARKRFKHFNDISPQSQNVASSPTRMPVRELLVGPPAERLPIKTDPEPITILFRVVQSAKRLF